MKTAQFSEVVASKLVKVMTKLALCLSRQAVDAWALSKALDS